MCVTPITHSWRGKRAALLITAKRKSYGFLPMGFFVNQEGARAVRLNPSQVVVHGDGKLPTPRYEDLLPVVGPEGIEQLFFRNNLVRRHDGLTVNPCLF